MAGVEEELWNIFTFYTLRGKPLDVTRLSVTQFLRLARDCKIIDEGQGVAASGSKLTGGSSRRVGPVAVNLAFASVLQRRYRFTVRKSRPLLDVSAFLFPTRDGEQAAAAKSKLTYPEFLDALAILSERVYRHEGCGGSLSSPKIQSLPVSSSPMTAGAAAPRVASMTKVEATFQRLLMENVLPLASRRRPTTVAAELRDPLVRDILSHYGPALRELFRFYASSPSISTPKARVSSSTSIHGGRGSRAGKRGKPRARAAPPSDTFVANVNLSPDPCGHGPSAAASGSEKTSHNATGGRYIIGGRDQKDSRGTRCISGRGGEGVKWRRQKATLPSVVVMNSMADALPLRSLLCFAADVGISGALMSALDVGDVFLSCNGGGQLGESANTDDANFGFNHERLSRGAWRTCLAREGRGGVRPLVFTEFLEALVRIALVCFLRPRCASLASVQIQRRGNVGTDATAIGAGCCLRALLAYMWRRLHASAEIALNGVRVGGSRHHSSMQKGALLRGIQLLNDRMLSRWRSEGFLDFAASEVSIGGATAITPNTTPPLGRALETLRRLLALDEGRLMGSAGFSVSAGG
ncbi:unnamed protein product [Ascophyllum nodosum]